MSKFIAYYRAFRGYCPQCNSDAPAIDRCPCCKSYRGTFPPDDALPAVWLARYFDIKGEAGGGQ